MLEGRHSPIVSSPPPPLASKSSRDPTRRHLPSPGGSRAAGTGAQRPPLRAGKRSFPLLRSRRAAPALSPQPGVPEVSHSQRVPAGAAPAAPLSAGRGAAIGVRRRRAVGRSRLFPGCAAEVAASSAARLSCLRGLPAPRCPEARHSPAASVRPSVRPARLPPPLSRRRTARRTGPAGGQEDPGATGDSGPASYPLPGAWCTPSAGRGGPAPAWRSAPGRSPAPRSRAPRGSLRHRRGRCYCCCRPGVSDRWVPRSDRLRSVPVPDDRLRL